MAISGNHEIRRIHNCPTYARGAATLALFLYSLLLLSPASAQVVGGGAPLPSAKRIYRSTLVESSRVVNAVAGKQGALPPGLLDAIEGDSARIWFEVPAPRTWRPEQQVPDFEKGRDRVRSGVNPEQSPAPRGATVQLSSFEGTDFDTNAFFQGFYSIPPDPDIAVGPTHIVTVVNSSLYRYTRGGSSVGAESLRSFFASESPNTGMFDPRVVYDAINARFVLLALETENIGPGDPANASRIFVAVSNTSDPTGGWTFQSINAVTTIGSKKHWADYPGIAIDEDAIYITANMFSFSDQTYGGTRLWIIDKMLGGGGLFDGGISPVSFFDPYALSGAGGSFGTLQPATVFLPLPAGNTGTYLVAYSGLMSGGSEFTLVIRVDSPVSSPTWSSAFVSLGDVDDSATVMPDASQSGSPELILTNDRRLLNAVWRSDRLYAVTTILPPTGPDAGEATAYWFQIDSSIPGSPVLSDAGTIGGESIAPGTSTFFPSVAINSSGDMAIGFSASGPGIFPGAYVTGRLSTDAPEITTHPQTLRAGRAPYFRTFGSQNRWGDYSGTVIDPLDDTTFWVFNEYALETGTVFPDLPNESGRWGTAIGHYQVVVSVPGAVLLVSPGNGAVDVPVTSMLQWNEEPSSASYDIQVSTQSDFSSTVVDVQGSIPLSLTLSGLTNSVLYFWRVRGENGNGKGTWSDVRSFTTVISAPASIILLSPANGTDQISATPALAWLTDPLATSYELEVSAIADFSDLAFQASGLAEPSVLVSPLDPDTKYYWRVRGSNTGGAGPWSTVWMFTTIVLPPGAVTLAGPSDASTGVERIQQLSWNPEGNAVAYQIQVGTTADFSAPLVDLSGLTAIVFTTPELAFGSTYYWRVRASNAGGTGPWSVIQSFTTIVAPPGMVMLDTPTENATLVPRSPVLSWFAESTSVSYDVQISGTPSFNPVAVNVTEVLALSFDLPELGYATSWYWRVRGRNGGGTGIWSDVRQFTTIEAAPGPVVLESPPDGATDQPLVLTLSWRAEPAADNYELLLSTSPDFASSPEFITVGYTFADPATLSVALPFALDNATTYFWKVRAVNTGGTGSWSNVWSLATVESPPTTPVLLLPTQDAVNISTTPAFSWVAVSSADAYDVEISTDVDFSNLVLLVEGEVVTTFAVNAPLDNGSLHYWRVRATNLGGPGSWSSTGRFTTIIASPGQVMLSSPPENAADVAVDPELTWEAESSSTIYDVDLSTAPDFSDRAYPIVSTSALSLVFTNLENSTHFYWRVRGRNVGGPGLWSAVRDFRTITAPPGSIVILIPVDAAVDIPIPVSFSWSSDPLASSYTIQVSKTDGFSDLLVDQTGIIGTELNEVPLTDGIDLWVRVRAENVGGDGAWSPIVTFQTRKSPPEPVALSLPEDGALDQPSNVTLVWNFVMDTIDYQVQLALNPEFSDPILDRSSVTLLQAETGILAYDTIHFWRVRARNEGGWGDWSEVRSFQVAVGTARETDSLVFPQFFDVQQPYPNPFDRSVILAFDLPETTTARIEIFDPQGRLVAVPLYRSLSAGRYEIPWTPENVPSGLYFVRISTESSSVSRSLLYLR